MTNCYICSHPILEGQPTRSNDTGSTFEYWLEHRATDHPYPDAKWFHENPADHLPTLPEVKELAVDVKALDRQHAVGFRDGALHERERVAMMVEEAGRMADRGMMVDWKWVRNLAAQIRSGE